MQLPFQQLEYKRQLAQTYRALLLEIFKTLPQSKVESYTPAT